MPAVLDVPAVPKTVPTADPPAAPACPPGLRLPGVGVDGEGLTIPGCALSDFGGFRRWKLSDDCPEWGKFEWINNAMRIEVVPESLVTHGGPKLEIARTLAALILDEEDLGVCYTDSTTVTTPDDAERPVNCEPDFVFVSHEAILEGRVTLTPKVGRDGDFTEIVGPPDLVVEVRSDSSTRKDTIDLPADLFALGVREYWLADARVDPPTLTIHARGADRFEPVQSDGQGRGISSVFNRRFTLEATTGRSGLRRTRLVTHPA